MLKGNCKCLQFPKPKWLSDQIKQLRSNFTTMTYIYQKKKKKKIVHCIVYESGTYSWLSTDLQDKIASLTFLLPVATSYDPLYPIGASCD